MNVKIGRTSGPMTDQEATLEVTTRELEVVKDTLAAINAISNNKEKWYVQYDDGRRLVSMVPVSGPAVANKPAGADGD